MSENLTELCRQLEHFETPRWAAAAILQREIMPRVILDPCCGSGILCDAAAEEGYRVIPADIHDWGYPDTWVRDFLTFNIDLSATGVFMNPPFSLAEDFVRKCFALNARKILCFQRFAWRESRKRREFWQQFPPNRIYICGDRASCWRHDIPTAQRGSGTPTAHAWFVWEKGHPTGTLQGDVYKEEGVDE
jgi:hypothetical protein